MLTGVACATSASGEKPSPAVTKHDPGSVAKVPPGSTTDCADCWRPNLDESWQIQLTGKVDPSVKADVYEIDLFDSSAGLVQTLHDLGRKVVCYIDAGTWENWRPDAADFAQSVRGGSNGWPGERWLDIRQLGLLSPILQARLDLCRAKGFDGVDFDNVDGYTNHTGFPITYADQLSFNRFLAGQAHNRHLSVGLKNDPEQVLDLLPDFDWATVEECFQFQECASYRPFVEAGKPVIAIEYTLQPEEFCQQAQSLRFKAMRKRRNLDAFRTSC
ncbi:MAG: endo alpha-1,4 polygalactosaminidase [Actinobacteria bacterium]|nr:endo alpha-1,4 polygalactosaminidase [Actinomycetota bacterium]